jgi:DNA repair protein SbcC/Rad50
MRPIQLKVRAFGPFHQEQVIDFRPFASFGLFLIHGPTGAGKTSLFDAMCLALFGDTTSGRAPKEMRSQYAQVQDSTQVALVFKAKERYYKVVREYKPNRNGTALNPKFQFSEVDPIDFSDLSSPIGGEREIKSKVETVLGFTADQFKQIVVLPQGKFSEFLQAKTSEKQPILEQVFGTKIYDQIREKLKAQASAHEDALKEIETKRQGLLMATGLATEAALAAKLGELRLEIQQLDAQSSDLGRAWAAAETALNQGRELAERLAALAKCRAQKHEFAQQENIYLTKERKLEYANRAALLQAEIQQEKNLAIEHKILLEKAKKAREEWLQKSAERDRKETDLASKTEAHQATLQQYDILLAQLRQTLPKFDEIDALAAQLAAIQANRAAVEKKLAAAQAKLDGHRAQLASGQTRLASLEPQAGQLEALRLQLAQAQQRWQWAQQRDAQEAEWQKAEAAQKQALARLNTASQESQQAETSYNELEKRWIQGQAARLSLKLVAGEPCPVCGSPTHPHRANQADVVSDDALEQQKKRKAQAEAAKEAARGNFEKAQLAATKAQTAWQASLDQLGHQAKEPSGDLGRLAKDLLQQVAAAQDAQGELAKLGPKLAALEKEIEQLETEKNRSENELIQITAEEGHKAAQLAQLQGQLPPNCETREKVEARLKKGELIRQTELNEREKAEKEAQDLRVEVARRESESQSLAEQAANAEGALALLRQKNQQAATDRGFANPAEAERAFLPEPERQTLANEIERRKGDLIRLEAELQRLEAETAGQPPPDLPTIEAQRNAAQQAQRAHDQSLGEKRNMLAQDQKQAESLAQLAHKTSQLAEQAGPSRELYALANGDNAQKITLSAYVLAVLLDEVLDRANLRLATLSEARYTMARKEEASGGGKKGLDLEVFDANTGATRDVGNLSGGEMFFTSLALALGLADVASSRQGGVQMEALFIDEGFGTLDPEALERAIQVLTKLEARHRLVGIISHVGELRERIPARVEVRKRNTGSDIQLHLPNL